MKSAADRAGEMGNRNSGNTSIRRRLGERVKTTEAV
jgi:hypothetical protein